MSPTQWATLVAQDLGINVAADPNSVIDILGWMPHEENASQWWGGFGTAAAPERLNPLNAGDIGQFGYTGSPTTGNTLSGGLGTYPTLTAAAQAAAGMLGQSNMTPARNALLQGASPSAFTAAINSTPWAQDKYSPITAGQAEAEAQGPTVTSKPAVGAGAPGAAAAVSGALASQTNPAVIAQQNADQAIQQSLQLTPAELAAQQQILTQNYGYSQQQLGIQEKQLQLNIAEAEQQYNQAASQYGYQKQSDILSGQAISAAINNIATQYMFQEQGFEQSQQSLNLQTKEGLQGLAASGVYNTGTRGQFQQQQAIAQAGLTSQWQAATAAEKYAVLGQQQSMQQLGITEAQQASQYGYSQQQIRNGLQNLEYQNQALGISKAQAATQYQNALQQLDLNSIMGADQLETQIAALAGGGYSPLGGILGQLQTLIPGLAGAMGSSGTSLTAAGGNTTGG
jgi:hypothetical protein